MEWLSNILNPATLIFLIPIVAIVGGIGLSALKAQHRHQERIEKIRQGMDPDQRD